MMRRPRNFTIEIVRYNNVIKLSRNSNRKYTPILTLTKDVRQVSLKLCFVDVTTSHA